MKDVVDDLSQTASGELSVGASYTYGEYVLPRVAAALRSRYPRVNLKIKIGNTNDIAELVAARRLDVGVVEGNFRHRGKLRSESFAEDNMYVFASGDHPISRIGEVEAGRLREETWIVREEGSGTREAAERLFSELGFRPDRQMEFGSTQIIKESVEAGLGVTLLSDRTTHKELALGTLRRVKVSGTPIVRRFSLIALDTPYPTKAMEVFWELVRSRK